MSRFPFFTLIVVILSFWSCKTDPQNNENVIHIRLKKDPERINPIIFPNPTAREIYQYLHLPLADYDPKSLEMSPILIKQIPEMMVIDTGYYKGGIYFDIEIKDEAQWDDGSPITAEDYLFTVKTINLPLVNAMNYRKLTENIKKVEIDPTNHKKFRVIFDHNYLEALETAISIEVYPRYFYDVDNKLGSYKLSDFEAKNEEKIKADSTLVSFAALMNSNDFSRNKINGSGPYLFESWTPDQHIILSKKKNYWAKESQIPALMQGPQKMIFQIIPDELSAVSLLKNGSLDVVNEISADNYLDMQKDKNLASKFNFFHPALTKYFLILINNQDLILQDKQVRKALSHLLNVDNIIENLENGMGTRTVGPVNPMKKTYHHQLVPIPFDIEKAKEILLTNGWKDTNNNGIIDKKLNQKVTDLEIEILISGQELGKKIALMLQENGAKAGIKINITEKEFKQIRAENIKPRKYHLIASIQSQDLNPWDELSTKWHSENAKIDGTNEVSYSNPVADQIIDQLNMTKDNDKKMELYKKFQELIYEDQPAIFLYAPEEKLVVSKKWNSTSTAKRPGYMANTFTLAADFVPIPTH